MTSREIVDSWLRSTALNSGVFATWNACAVSPNIASVWSSYTYAALEVLRTLHEPRWKVRTLVRVAPVLKVRPPLSIFTRKPFSGVPSEPRKPFGSTSVKLDDS